jgi:DNA-binding Lrp family transcriptional regulator
VSDLDKTDAAILDCLQRDGRLSNAKLAEHLSQHTTEATAAFERIIQASPNVLACHNTTGDADFLLQVVARDLDDYSRFVEVVLRKLPFVSSIRSNLSLREMKASNRLPVTDIL